MTQQEFESRFGSSVPEHIYTGYIEPMYMAVSMDKDEFCADFKKHGLMISEIASELVDEIKTLKAEVARLQQERSDLVDFLLSQSKGEDTLEQQAINMVGQKEVLKRKLQQGGEINSWDKEFILNNLV